MKKETVFKLLLGAAATLTGGAISDGVNDYLIGAKIGTVIEKQVAMEARIQALEVYHAQTIPIDAFDM